jgi:hypothetical protein
MVQCYTQQHSHIDFTCGAGGQDLISASLIFSVTLFEMALGAVKISVSIIAHVYQLF